MTGAVDQWHLAGSAEGLQPGKVRALALCGREIAIWRTGSGRFHACEDRCVHRGTRLSIGFVRGNQLVCPYHGWHYGEDGRCSFIPAHPDMTPAENLCLPRFAAAEEAGLLWVSPGTPTTPPPDLEGYLYCRSLPVQTDAADLAKKVSSLRFLPSSLTVDSDPLRPWGYLADDGDAGRERLHWSRPGGEAVMVGYSIAEPAQGLIAITASGEGLTETRLFALQPESEGRTVLHFLIAGGSGEAAGRRQALALWAKRLRWFLENSGADAQSYNPWGREVCCS